MDDFQNDDNFQQGSDIPSGGGSESSDFSIPEEFLSYVHVSFCF